MSKILCSDLECEFKCRYRIGDKSIDECSLDVADAIMFYDKFKITTCCIGCGEKYIKDNPELTKETINNLKHKGEF